MRTGLHASDAFLIILMLALPSFAPCAEGQMRGLRGQLIELGAHHNFVVKGLERLDDEPAKVVVGDLRGQVSALLRDYNFVFIEDGQGGIREVWIFDHKPAQPNSQQPVRPSYQPPSQQPDRSYSVRTTRRGSHHYVEAALTGPNIRPHSASLLIDTGASTVVLPASMIETLGFRNVDLRDGWTQAVSGRIPIKRGILASVRVGDAVAENIEVSFIADEYLGNQRILGMSFLRSFRIFSFDDKSSELILFSQ